MFNLSLEEFQNAFYDIKHRAIEVLNKFSEIDSKFYWPYDPDMRITIDDENVWFDIYWRGDDYNFAISLGAIFDNNIFERESAELAAQVEKRLEEERSEKERRENTKVIHTDKTTYEAFQEFLKERNQSNV